MSETGDLDADSRSFKSCFARSVAMNSERNSKEVPRDALEFFGKTRTVPDEDVVRLRKNPRSRIEDSRRHSLHNVSNFRRSSLCTSRIAEIPVENLVYQSKIETLEWQIKEIQRSQQMYRAVMKSVVTYLEKAQHSLELLGYRMNRKSSVHRSKSEHQVSVENPENLKAKSSTLADYSWKQPKPEILTEEIPPEKLAQEAFRLLRTAQSLLKTQEPDLVKVPGCCPTEEIRDVEFLAQVAKEFPNKPQRTTSFSSTTSTPKVLLPEAEVKVCTAFNRKLSLQLNDVRRCSKVFRSTDSARGSVAESEMEFPHQEKSKTEKSNSPANSSISSVEDESGFSSMNSFQEIGLPLTESTLLGEEVSMKKTLLRSMLHNAVPDYSSLDFSVNNNQTELENSCHKKDQIQEEAKLWQTPQHKRWYSTPATEEQNSTSKSLKVLWV